jgi:dUTP pyrophosphatase
MDIKQELEDLKKMTNIINGLNNMNISEDVDYSETIKELEKISEKSDNYMKIYYKNTSNNKNPIYEHNDDSGFDLRADIDTSVTLKPLERKLIPTGLYFELPPNTELQVRPRSGMALKHGITVLNTPGTVDSNYRGEVGIILVNLSNEPFTINSGDRVAQAVIMNVINPNFSTLINKDDLSTTDRGENGFGSTGKS